MNYRADYSSGRKSSIERRTRSGFAWRWIYRINFDSIVPFSRLSIYLEKSLLERAGWPSATNARAPLIEAAAARDRTYPKSRMIRFFRGKRWKLERECRPSFPSVEEEFPLFHVDFARYVRGVWKKLLGSASARCKEHNCHKVTTARHVEELLIHRQSWHFHFHAEI